MQQTDIHFFLSNLAHFYLEWEMCQTKAAEIIETHILCSVTFLENCAVYEIMWKNIVQPGRPQMTIWRMRIACWISKTTHTHTHTHTICNTAFALQQWSQARASTLCYTYIACLVVSFVRDHTCNYVPAPLSRVLLKKLTGSQLAKKFLAYYGTRRFITAPTSARHLSLSWGSSIHTCNSNFNGMCSSGLRMTS